MENLIGILLVVLIPIILIILSRPRVSVKSHWQHFFDGQAISTGEFYEQVKKGLRSRKIEVGVTTEAMAQTHIFSDKREYLRIAKSDLLIYVCGAPFGTGSFISWWQCETEEGFLNRIPVLSRLMGKDRKNKTFYQMDIEAMYKSGIHTTVMSVVEAFTTTNGKRGLTDIEKQYKDAR